MKKFLAILLVAVLALSLVSCGNNADGGDKGGDKTDDKNDSTQSTYVPLEVLEKVWESFTDDEKFPVAGGDMTEENMNMEGPGKFGVEDTSALDTTLAFPTTAADKIDDAASLVHMMNANTFTCGAFHVKDAADVDSVASAIKDSVMQRQWICGFPDKLVVVKVGDCVVSFFGAEDLVDAFKTKLTAAYDASEIVCDEPVA